MMLVIVVASFVDYIQGGDEIGLPGRLASPMCPLKASCSSGCPWWISCHHNHSRQYMRTNIIFSYNDALIEPIKLNSSRYVYVLFTAVLI